MSFGALVCGSSLRDGIAKNALDHLRQSIDHFSDKALGFLHTDFSEDAQSFGSFCARVVLENSCAGLVGRIDPFRLIYLREFQSQGGFEYGKPSKSGFKWTGDVIADEKPVANMWSSDHDMGRISRALFSQHVDHIYWKPAMERAFDYINSLPYSIEMDDVLQFNPDDFINATRGRCNALYSTLSKGVHWEFFTSAIAMDEATVKSSIRDCFTLLGILAFFSHFIPTAFGCFSPEEAIENYKAHRGMLN